MRLLVHVLLFLTQCAIMYPATLIYVFLTCDAPKMWAACACVVEDIFGDAK
jgi:hypothetical protein